MSYIIFSEHNEKTMTYTQLHDTCSRHDTHGVISRCRSNPEEIVELDDHGLTPLHTLFHISNPSSDAIACILRANSQVLVMRDTHGDTPLHWALKWNDINFSIIDMLVSSSANTLSIPNNAGALPLHTACRFCSGRIDIIRLLVNKYPPALRRHVKLGSLVKRKSPRNVDTLTFRKPSDHVVLDPAAKHSNIFELTYLENGTQLRDGSYPIHIALHERAPFEVVQLLLSSYPESLNLRDKFDKKPIDIAIDKSYGDDMLSLLNA